MRTETTPKTTSIIYLYMFYLSVLFSCKAPGFQVVSPAQKTPQPIVPKEKSYSSSCKNQKASTSVGENFTQTTHHNSQPTNQLFQVCFFPAHSQPGSGQGSPCGFDQVPSSQSLSSSTALVKNEHQVCVFCVS